MPTLAVPLCAPFANVLLDLQAAFADIYQRGGYAADIDYTSAVPAPALRPPLALWLRTQLNNWRAQAG